jgi:hypothetical protein
MSRDSTSIMMDWLRPSEADGALVGAVFSTYGLSLDQPDFFGQDFLPTLLGLGGVRDRGYGSPVTLDRALATANVSLICDAHALTAGARPTLRVDVLPVGHKVQHAKVLLIHRYNRIRLIVGSANLTHEGFRRQREAAAVLDFREDGSLPPALLTQALSRWESALGGVADDQVRRVFASAVKCARQWSAQPPSENSLHLEVVFGGASDPLWRQLVDAWPQGEPISNWQVCSPFWPQVEQTPASTPFEAIADGLAAKGCSMDDCELEIITRAHTPSPNALPQFPFALIAHLRSRAFPVRRGRILPARLDAAPDEIPAGMSGENRDLHAKYIVLAGPATVLAYVGSANFTRRGLGVLWDPLAANLEAGVLIRWARRKWRPEEWHPPIQGQIIDWASCCGDDLTEPVAEQEETPDWADFVQHIELAIHWENLPEPDGELCVRLRPGEARAFCVALPPFSNDDKSPAVVTADTLSPVCLAATSQQVRHLLARRTVEILWNDCKSHCLFPVNIGHESKAGMPSILGAKPSEEQLLAYFHGHISEEDLLARLEQQARGRNDQNGSGPTEIERDIERIRRLQNYVVREFIESLYGLTRTIQEASYSPRAAEQALLGDLSPVCLAERVVQAFLTGKRTSTAAAFQLAELVRVINDLSWPAESPPAERQAFEDVRRRALDRLCGFVRQASTQSDFVAVSRDKAFSECLRAILPIELARRWTVLAQESSKDDMPKDVEVNA